MVSKILCLILVFYFSSLSVMSEGETSQKRFWTQELFENLEIKEGNIVPPYKPSGKEILPGYYTWDFWPLYDLNGKPTRINGHNVLFCLSAPKTYDPEGRHDYAKIRYFISKDGKNWVDQGDLFPNNAALGSRQWTGSFYWDPQSKKVLFFYTATGDKGEEEVSFKQQIAFTKATPLFRGSKLVFRNWDKHKIILKPDGEIYDDSVDKDSIGVVPAFRDPFFFIDPKTGKRYILFSSRTAEGPQIYNASIGLAFAKSEDLSDWVLLPPLLVSQNSAAEMEVSHLQYTGGLYYLFFTTMAYGLNPELQSRYSGLYGFAAKNINGPYSPMNKNGLVIANPVSNPYQNHAFRTIPICEKVFKVMSWANYDIPEAGQNPFNQTPEWQKKYIRATLAPSFKIIVDGYEARVFTEEQVPQKENPLESTESSK